MAGEGGGQRTEVAAQGWFDRARQWWQRARDVPGYERHALLLVLKGTLAATLAWVVSYYALDAPSSAFAPFSAVLIMQVTVYQSLLQSLRYLAAVAAGVAMVAGLGFLGGPDLLTFVLVAVVGLSIGRRPALGAQGSQVATAAFFAFSTYASATSATEKLSQLGQIILLVLIGCGIGVVVNVTVAPPMRYRSAEYGIRSLSTALVELMSDMYPVLREGELDEERCRRWRRRAEQTGGLITQARDGFRTAEESLYYNPRRLLRRHRGRASFEGYGAVLEALERSLYQVASLTRSLHQWHEEEGGQARRPGLPPRLCRLPRGSRADRQGARRPGRGLSRGAGPTAASPGRRGAGTLPERDRRRQPGRPPAGRPGSPVRSSRRRGHPPHGGVPARLRCAGTVR